MLNNYSLYIGNYRLMMLMINKRTPAVQSTARKPEKRAGDESSGQVRHNMDATVTNLSVFHSCLSHGVRAY